MVEDSRDILDEGVSAGGLVAESLALLRDGSAELVLVRAEIDTGTKQAVEHGAAVAFFELLERGNGLPSKSGHQRTPGCLRQPVWIHAVQCDRCTAVRLFSYYLVAELCELLFSQSRQNGDGSVRAFLMMSGMACGRPQTYLRLEPPNHSTPPDARHCR